MYFLKQRYANQLKFRSGEAVVFRLPLRCLKALPHVTISSTMAFNIAKIASARASSTLSLRVAGPLVSVTDWAADGTRNSEFTNKLERKTHGTELRIRRVSPCFVEAASPKAD